MNGKETPLYCPSFLTAVQLFLPLCWWPLQPLEGLQESPLLGFDFIYTQQCFGATVHKPITGTEAA